MTKNKTICLSLSVFGESWEENVPNSNNCDNFAGDLRDLPTVLYVPVLNPCMATEKLSVAVNIQTGNFMVALGGKGLF